MVVMVAKLAAVVKTAGAIERVELVRLLVSRFESDQRSSNYSYGY